MKLDEILDDGQIVEGAWRNALAASALGTMSLLAPSPVSTPEPLEPQTQDEIITHDQRFKFAEPGTPDIKAPTFAKRLKLTKNIASNYRIEEQLARKVVDLAFKYADEEFPKAEDILAVIGVESSFNPNAVSNLKRDPAVGLMQVRPGIWNLDPNRLGNIEHQIKYGVDILKHYYQKTGNREDALHAYNLGITRFRRGGRNPRYVHKYQQVRNVVSE